MLPIRLHSCAASWHDTRHVGRAHHNLLRQDLHVSDNTVRHDDSKQSPEMKLVVPCSNGGSLFPPIKSFSAGASVTEPAVRSRNSQCSSFIHAAAAGAWKPLTMKSINRCSRGHRKESSNDESVVKEAIFQQSTRNLRNPLLPSFVFFYNLSFFRGRSSRISRPSYSRAKRGSPQNLSGGKSYLLFLLLKFRQTYQRIITCQRC